MSGAKRPLHPGPPLLDRAAILNHFARASSTYDGAALLAERLRSQLIERLDWIAFAPESVLDLGCGTGHGAALLAARWPRARVVALDASPAMLREAARRGEARRIERLLAEAEAMPLPDASVDLVFSNLMLPWCEDIDAVFAEVARVLRPQGLFTFTTFGPDTLKELRAAWEAADDAQHVHPFTGLHDLGDGLVRAGLSEPVLDVSRYTLTYPDVGALMRDLKATGAQNAAGGRQRGLTGRGRLAAMAAAYESFRSDGVLPASHEVVFGQAWGAVPRARRNGREAFAIPVASIGRRNPAE
jgi:malonyl-CoA O-methyltransferase